MDTHVSSLFVILIGLFHVSSVTAFLRCIECTHIMFEPKNDFEGAQSVYNILLNKINTACAQADPYNVEEYNTNQQALLERMQGWGFFNLGNLNQRVIGETVCPDSNGLNKCSYIYADVDIYLPTYSAQMRLNMHVRNCMTVDFNIEDKCYDRTTNIGYSEAKQFFQNRLGFLSLDVEVRAVNGRQCYCQTDMCRPIVSAATRGLSALSMALTLLVAVVTKITMA